MKKLLAVAVMAVTFCLAGMVMSGEAQAQRFVDNGDGTVTDTHTGLMWTKDANPFGKLNWHDAMSACSSFSISGIGGWRLPIRGDLVGLFRGIKGGHPFTGVQRSYYWSSTTESDSTAFAWSVGIGDCSVYNGLKDYTGNGVWPVRTARCFRPGRYGCY